MDTSYESIVYRPFQLEHLYGENVFILSSPLMLTLLTQFADPKTKQPRLNYLLQEMYRELLNTVLNTMMPLETRVVPSRMGEAHPDHPYRGIQHRKSEKVIVASIARAGTEPAQICYDQLNHLYLPDHIHQDHIFMNRRVNDKGEVVGIDFSGSKLSVDVADGVVLIPDPMGATGASISFVLDQYKAGAKSPASKFVSMHLVVTPEYIKRMKEEHPDLFIFALRVDRPFSSFDALSSLPGKFIDQESGLNSKQYIVPGLGGVGELLNNSKN